MVSLQRKIIFSLFFVCKIVRKFVHLHSLKSCFRFLSYKIKF
nr:MAG TPA: hypothetical protein [Caudoviricetes sp.]